MATTRILIHREGAKKRATLPYRVDHSHGSRGEEEQLWLAIQVQLWRRGADAKRTEGRMLGKSVRGGSRENQQEKQQRRCALAVAGGWFSLPADLRPMMELPRTIWG